MDDKKLSVAGKRGISLTAIALAACMLLSLSGWSVKNAWAIDLERNCSLTVRPGSMEDVEHANVVIDLYRVADPVPVAGYDTYTYHAASPYGEFEERLNGMPSMTNEDYRALAEDAAKLTLKNDMTVAKTVDGARAGGQMEGLKSGLYLVIARGAEIEDYVTTTVDEDGKEHIATVAWSEEWVYTFQPELISLPSKEADGAGSVNTANPGEWIYDLTATLKPSQNVRFGSLEIVKTLTVYENREPANFVFQVEAYENETKEKTVYSNVVTITFSEAGQRSIRLEKVIPVGAYVEVTEVYSGAAYELTTEETQSAVISAEEIASVAFTNSYDKSGKGGGAITNHFVYEAENGWSSSE